jgi:hypothetical protein
MAFLHFSSERFERVKRGLSQEDGFQEGFELFNRSIPRQFRDELLSRRRRDDGEYFRTFGEI